VEVSHKFAEESALFDDDHLVSLAGLVPVIHQPRVETQSHQPKQ
jgi:hypothetical protein